MVVQTAHALLVLDPAGHLGTGLTGVHSIPVERSAVATTSLLPWPPAVAKLTGMTIQAIASRIVTPTSEYPSLEMVTPVL
jgi:hypothetical protein